jgi:hypothetical protein
MPSCDSHRISRFRKDVNIYNIHSVISHKELGLFSGVRKTSLLDFKTIRLRLRKITKNRFECYIFLRYRYRRLE